MEEYNILNSIKPAYFRSRFPYNIIDPKKIKFTMNKIEIWAKEEDKSNPHAKTGGSVKPIPIKFYG